jgi:transposase-like protein
LANRGFEPKQVEQIIRAFLECGGNYTHAADKAGVGYNAVLKYVRRWQSGQVVIEELPPVAIAAAKGGNATELPALKAVRAENVSLRKERDELLKEIETLRKVADLSDMTRKHSVQTP